MNTIKQYTFSAQLMAVAVAMLPALASAAGSGSAITQGPTAVQEQRVTPSDEQPVAAKPGVSQTIKTTPAAAMPASTASGAPTIPGAATVKPGAMTAPGMPTTAPAQSTSLANLLGTDERAIIIVGGKQTSVAQFKQELGLAQAGAPLSNNGVLKDLLALNDGAIIIVGGRQVRAGELKRTINSPALRTAGPGAAVMLNPQPLPPKATGGFQSGASAHATSPAGSRAAVGPPFKVATGISDKTDPKSNTTKSPAKLSDMEDRAIIIVDGKKTTAGALKKAINAEIAAKAGPPKTVKGGTRKLDLAALNVTTGAATAQPAPQSNMRRVSPGSVPPQATTASQASPRQAAIIAPSTATEDKSGAYDSMKCLDKGPPTISEVQGRLKPGGKVTIWGRCFGDRAGRVEIIGQFTAGKLKPAFTAWDMTGIEIEIPANIRGAADHAVAVTVVTADGKTSAAMQAQFVAAREHIEVPANLWSPGAQFDFSADYGTRDLVGPTEGNEAYAGHTVKTLRVQPQCALETMDAVASSGSISAIRGWEQPGPQNEASVTIDWMGTCSTRRTLTTTDLVFTSWDSSIFTTSTCRVAFLVQAWAYCPAGIAP